MLRKFFSKSNPNKISTVPDTHLTQLDTKSRHGRNALHKAVSSGNIEATHEILNVQPDLIDSVDNEDNTALHHAVKKNKINHAMVRLLLEKGANVNIKNKKGQTPIFVAFENTQVSDADDEILIELFTKTHQLDHQDRQGQTLLHVAINQGISNSIFSQILSQIYNYPAYDINQQDKFDQTPVYLAVRKNDMEKLNLLIKWNTDLNLNGTLRKRPLHDAISSNHTAIAKRLMEAGAACDLQDDDGNTPLVCAGENGNVEMIEALHLRVNFSDEAGKTAVSRALLNYHIASVEKLIELGASPLAQVYPRKSGGGKALSSGFSMSKSDYHVTTSYKGLLNSGDTALHFAVLTNNEVLAQACLKADKATVNVVNDHNNTPVTIAIKTMNPQMANLLKREGDKFKLTQPNTTHPQKTLYMQAVTRGFESAEKLDQFFNVENYPLTEKQKQIQTDVNKRYFRNTNEASFALLKIHSILGAGKVNSPQAKEVDVDMKESSGYKM